MGLYISRPFMRDAQKVLGEMLKEGKTSAPMPGSIPNLFVVIGYSPYAPLIVVEVPEDLKDRVGDKEVSVVIR